MFRVFLPLLLLTASHFPFMHAAEPERTMNFVTVSDTEHFPWVEGLIDSTLKYNYTKISKFAVFDLGLTKQEVETLKQKPFVDVHKIEDINPDMRKKFAVRTNGRLARGWYTWKPTVFYQATQMFPHFLYLDAGFEVAAPLDSIFDEIREKGYYLYDGSHLIFPVVTKHVRELFELEGETNKWLIEESCISGGIQGLSRSLLDSYIKPMYELAKHIENFEDDGTAYWGYGFARHDQTLFSIFVRKLGLKTHPLFCTPKKIRINDRTIYFGILRHFKFRKHKERDAKRLEHARINNLLG